jgi:hypothetical protein
MTSAVVPSRRNKINPAIVPVAFVGKDGETYFSTRKAIRRAVEKGKLQKFRLPTTPTEVTFEHNCEKQECEKREFDEMLAEMCEKPDCSEMPNCKNCGHSAFQHLRFFQNRLEWLFSDLPVAQCNRYDDGEWEN